MVLSRLLRTKTENQAVSRSELLKALRLEEPEIERKARLEKAWEGFQQLLEQEVGREQPEKE
jgi:hypothetical protein